MTIKTHKVVEYQVCLGNTPMTLADHCRGCGNWGFWVVPIGWEPGMDFREPDDGALAAPDHRSEQYHVDTRARCAYHDGMANEMMTAQDLREWMDEFGYSVNALAGRLDVAPSSVQRWRDGTHPITHMTAIAIRALPPRWGKWKVLEGDLIQVD